MKFLYSWGKSFFGLIVFSFTFISLVVVSYLLVGRIFAQVATSWTIDKDGSTNNIRFYYNGLSGSPAQVITSANVVGIGTTNPDSLSLLDISQPSSGGDGLFLSARSAGNAPFLTWKTTDASYPKYSIRYNGGANGRLQIGQGDSQGFAEQMSILSGSGNVGIGTTGPAGTLDVRDSSARQVLLVNSASGPYSFLNAQANAHLTGNGYWNGSAWNRFSTTSNSALVDAQGDLGIITFFTAAAGANPLSWPERMRIDNSGKVGIGTTNPVQRLHVLSDEIALQSSSNTGGRLEVYDSNVNGNLGYRVRTSVGGGWRWQFVDGANNEFFGVEYPTGNTTIKGVITATACTGCNPPSDQRLKNNITPLSDSLSLIMKLKGVSFEWNKTNPLGVTLPAGKHIGLIAQEVEKVVPQAVTTNDKGYKSIDYNEITPLLIEAIKQQQKEIDQLKLEVQKLKSAK